MNKIPKYVLKLLERRRKLAFELCSVCCDVDDYCGGNRRSIGEEEGGEMTDREKQKEKLIELIENTPGVSFSPDAGDMIADHLIANGVTVQEWIPASIPPTDYRDEHGELIPFLVCEEGTEYPFRAMYDGKTWGDGLFAVPATHWMPLPEPPKGE